MIQLLHPLSDANGNPIKAEGQDGELGQTPKIRVNTDGEWEVSLDGSKTWQAILDKMVGIGVIMSGIILV